MELERHEFIRMVRHLKGLNLQQFSDVMGISDKTLSKLEGGSLEFSDYYKAKFNQACRDLNLSPIEVHSLKILLQVREEMKND